MKFVRLPAEIVRGLGRLTCARKIRYGHLSTAERAVQAMAKKGSLGMEAYPCPYCKGFHIGHRPKPRVTIEWLK